MTQYPRGEMDEIPEDILDVARRVVRSLGDADHDSGENAEAIARAIMAERERCEAIAAPFPINYGPYARATDLEKQAHDIRTVIAAAIRKGPTP